MADIGSVINKGNQIKQMNKLISFFEIRDLFGTTNFFLPLDSKAKIIIGENGLGKTQILNMLYYTLTKKFERLLEYSFTSIHLGFEEGEIVEIRRNEIELMLEGIPIVKDVMEKIGVSKFLEIASNIQNSEEVLYEFRRNSSKRRNWESLPIPTGMLVDALEVYLRSGKRQRSLFETSLGYQADIIDNPLCG